MIERFWQQVSATQPVPEVRWVIATGVAALILVSHHRTWPWIRLAVTVVHEAGHALVAVLVGRRLAGIKVHSDTSGVTVSRGRPSGPGMVVMLMAGYLAPAALGLGATLLLTHGHALALLWLLIAVLVGVLVWVRNGYGLLTVLVLGAALAAATHYASAQTQSVIATLVAWVLLLAAPRPLVDLLRRSRAQRRGSDPDQLARLTHLPAALWIVVLLAANLTGLVVGGATLVPRL
ncbi:M50 family metallopeptidase [Nocardioides nematodiphilus]|uniref:M50 family metallopeptidase n=1 Tax=Nocardioides nematodiphilus TaxID=2849669 RepID=UPI001CD9946F|nr:M50 family metallopeptidase [Nocardioides nematodiphilus]MCA1981379.1 M50 family metallopeptidase [Nocardioides nematodiphilus]